MSDDAFRNTPSDGDHCAAILLVTGILLMAETWMNVGPNLPSRCLLQFPKWFGCALANHENLAGGLIGASGTIFAGWIAWRAAMRNHRDPRSRGDGGPQHYFGRT